MENTCKKIKEQIPALVTGTLPVEQIAEMREHLDQCLDCKTYQQAMEGDDRLFGDFVESAQPHIQRITENVINVLAQEGTLQEDTARTIRVIPERRLSKLAAAVLIAAVVMIFAHLFDFFGVRAPAYDMAYLPRLVNEARSVHLHYTTHFDLSEYGTNPPPVSAELWIDLTGYRFREPYLVLHFKGNKFGNILTGESILNGGYLMGVDNARKTVTFYKLGDYQKMYKAHSKLSSTFSLYAGLDFFRDFQYMGKERIDGIEYDVWENEILSGRGKNKVRWRHKYWVSPVTHEPVRFENWQLKSGGEWVLKGEHDKIEWNIDIPDEVFAFEVPAGYECKNTMETAEPFELDEIGYADYRRALLDARINFTLADGSVIMAWSSEDQPATEPQDKYFESLQTGGNLPPLPLEPYALKLFTPASDITYYGRHLAYTKKQGQYIEWGLYVPDGPPPQRYEETRYEVIYRFNFQPEPDWRTSPISFGHGLVIESPEDFCKWILGAMAELSDYGAAPQDLTYEGVLALSKQIAYQLAKRREL